MKTLSLTANPADSHSRRSVSRTATVLVLLWLLISKCLAQSTITNIISGVIGVPGERAVYTFSLATDSRFYFDALANVPCLQWSLSGPQGRAVADRFLTPSDVE